MQFVEFSGRISGKEVTLPYATSCLRAYAESFADICATVDFAPTVFLPERFDALVERIGRPDLLALSCYVWNFNSSMALAAEVKRRSPETIVVVGGPHPKYGDSTVFDAHPAVDGIVQGEGEGVFLALLRGLVADGRLSPIDGLTFRDPDDGSIRVSPLRGRNGDLSGLRSPYAAGLMDGPLAALRGRRGAAMLESNRGCPFQCTFCDWGSLGSKIVEFPLERVLADIDWIAGNSVECVWMGDSNFGMRKRDKEISAYLADTYRRSSYPRRLNVATSKNSSRAILDALLPLAKTPMFRGATLSFQSLAEPVLRNIKRQNIKGSTYFELLEHARARGERTYTELILGLPGETLASFKTGLAIGIDSGPSTVIVNRCVLLPNAELASAAHRSLYDIRTAWLPIVDATETDLRFTETYEIVVGTSTMPEADWAECVEFAWLALLLYSTGLGQPALLLLRSVMGLDTTAVLEGMLDFMRRHPDGPLGGELRALQQDVARFLEFRDPTVRLSRAEVPWRADPEAAARISRIELLSRYDQCAAELTRMTSTVARSLGNPIGDATRHDLFLLLRWTTCRPIPALDQRVDFETDLPTVLGAAAEGRATPVTQRPSSFRLAFPTGLSTDSFRARVMHTFEADHGLEPFTLTPEVAQLVS